MGQTYRAESPADLCREMLGDISAEFTVFNPSVSLFGGVVPLLYNASPPIEGNVVVAEPVTDYLTDRVVVATMVRDLLDRGRIRLHSAMIDQQSTFIVAADRVMLPVQLDTEYGFWVMDDSAAADLTDFAEDQISTAEQVSIGLPGLGEIVSTAANTFGDDVAADLEQAFEVAAEQPIPVDPVQVVLLVSGSHGLMLYDIFDWVEAICLGSTTTVSRAKTALEDRELLDTENVQVGVGHPRHRLKLGPVYVNDETAANAREIVGALG